MLIYRDVAFYFVGVCFIIVLGFIGEITWVSSVLLLALYLLLVIVVFIQEKMVSNEE